MKTIWKAIRETLVIEIGVMFTLLVLSVLAFHVFLFKLGEQDDNVMVVNVVNKPELEFKFEKFVGLPDRSKTIQLVPSKDIQFEKMHQTLYQYPDKKYGWLLQYRIKSTDPTKPLAYHDPVKRDEQGKVLYPIEMHKLWLKPVINDKKWKLIWAEGEECQTWDSKGEILCIGQADENLGYWREGFISLEVYPKDGFDSTGKPIDGVPIHLFEVVFHIYPIE